MMEIKIAFTHNGFLLSRTMALKLVPVPKHLVGCDGVHDSGYPIKDNNRNTNNIYGVEVLIQRQVNSKQQMSLTNS